MFFTDLIDAIFGKPAPPQPDHPVYPVQTPPVVVTPAAPEDTSYTSEAAQRRTTTKRATPAGGAPPARVKRVKRQGAVVTEYKVTPTRADFSGELKLKGKSAKKYSNRNDLETAAIKYWNGEKEKPADLENVLGYIAFYPVSKIGPKILRSKAVDTAKMIGLYRLPAFGVNLTAAIPTPIIIKAGTKASDRPGAMIPKGKYLVVRSTKTGISVIKKSGTMNFGSGSLKATATALEAESLKLGWRKMTVRYWGYPKARFINVNKPQVLDLPYWAEVKRGKLHQSGAQKFTGTAGNKVAAGFKKAVSFGFWD